VNTSAFVIFQITHAFKALAEADTLIFLKCRLS